MLFPPPTKCAILCRGYEDLCKSKLKSKTNEEISKATGGFGIPGFKWPL